MVAADQDYFLMSFRFDKNKPEDFGMTPAAEESGVYIRQADGSRWLQKDLYDFGWGNEYGFVRLPELDFDQLWQQITRSKIPDNRYGAAFELQNRYPTELLNQLWKIFSRPRPVARSALRAVEILNLDQVGDLDSFTGQNINAVETLYHQRQFVKWKFELLRKKPGTRARNLWPRNINGYLLSGLLLLLIWALTFTGHQLLLQLAQQAKIRAVIQMGRLAPLPEDVYGLQTGEAEGGARVLPPAGVLLKFAAPRRQIARFLKDSGGLRGVRPKPFYYSEWYNTHLKMVSRYPWFDPTVQKGRLFNIPPGKNAGYSPVSGRLIVDDARGVVYIEMFRSRF